MGFCACMFNSYRICAQILYSDLLDYFFDERSTGDAKGLTGECDLLRNVLVMILTYHEVLMVYGPLGGGSLLGIFRWCVVHRGSFFH